MAFRIRKVLVAVGEGPARKAVERAATIAAAAKAHVELFSVVRPIPPVLGMTRIDDAKLTQAMANSKRDELEKLAKRVRAHGLPATCTVTTDYAVSEAIVRHVLQSGSDLVVIEAHKHNPLARLLLSQHDYDMIRECPVPLLIVKGSRHKPKMPVLAALDPDRANAKPRGLDDRIVGVARELAHLLGASLHTAHVYSPLIGFVSDATFAPMAIPVSALDDRKYVAAIRRRFKAANARYRIAPRNAHLRPGDAGFALPALARSLKAQLLVMGAISRSAVRRILIGSTAERVLGALPCDILVVKPLSFRSAIR